MPNRIIKESICTSGTLSECSVGANLLFDRLTTKADDHGCFDARTKIIRGGVFPLMMDKVKETDIEKWLNELLSVDCVRMWTHENGVRYGLFPNFSDHQTIRSLHKRKTPEPPSSITALVLDTSASDCGCNQLLATECLNHNHNHKPIKPIVRKEDFAPHRKRFEKFWKTLRPEMKKGREEAWGYFKKQVKTEQDFMNIQKALKNYIADVEQIQATKQPELQFQNGSTWFNHRWKDYVEMAKAETWAEKMKREKEENANTG